MEDTEEQTLPCQDKLAFDTKHKAEDSAIVAHWQHGGKLKVYLCKHCNLWHLASNFDK